MATVAVAVAVAVVVVVVVAVAFLFLLFLLFLLLLSERTSGVSPVIFVWDIVIVVDSFICDSTKQSDWTAFNIFVIFSKKCNILQNFSYSSQVSRAGPTN